MAKFVTPIPASLTKFSSKPIDTGKKRKVAGYARVSTDYDEQLSSYELQVRYYKDYISGHDGWQLVDVYTDEGISATHTEKRTGFQNMINDALEGKIDLIITKSVSRFARNTVDSLTTIRKLKNNGIEVYFEKENIWTFDSKGELMLSIMSSLAQEESRSISENVLWGIRKRYKDGKFSLAYSKFLGYDKGEDGNLIINPTQAKTVQFIFQSFLEGMTPYTISRLLIERGDKTGSGGLGWTSESIIRILKNEKYCGCALLQKTFKTDLLSKRRINNGEIQKYLVKNSHEAIISQEQFDMVQVELDERKKSLRQHSAKSIFSGKLICGDCGEDFGSKLWHSTDKYRRTVWQCNHKYKTGIKCTTPHFTEPQIKKLFLKALNQIIIDKSNVIPDLQEIADQLLNTTELEAQLSKAQAKLEIAKSAINQYFNGAPVADVAFFEHLQKEYTSAQAKVDKLQSQISDRKNRSRKTEIFIKEISELDFPITEFSDQMWLGLVDKIIVHSKDNIEVVFRSGQAIEVAK